MQQVNKRGRELNNMAERTSKSWLEYLRVITPVGIFVLTVYVNMMNATIMGVKSEVTEMRAELLHHLTNSDLHMPRSTVTSKDEFTIYQNMRDKQMLDIRDSMYRVENLLQKHITR
jgi:hypothetical protein